MIKLVYFKAIDDVQVLLDNLPKGLVEKVDVVDSDPPETHVFVGDKTTEEEKQTIDAEVKACDDKLPPTPTTVLADILVNEERKI